ncbi:hypothetical protein Q4Q34_03980 [Flavivirga abyssicola]|uniref:hypothetical protein n=1 Tax=Flavivirga abyssicola TaxID=3063533 RepID=UPI0026DF56F5|nr:hypothetical protein [Flavivirga sp. MEBiC07777]WVK14188.1 hypothetical protein Q4Q34_03980 [Flavivirga sp. MEBiC07777]
MKKNKIYHLLIILLLISSITMFVYKFYYKKSDAINNKISVINKKNQKKWKNKELLFSEGLVPLNTNKTLNSFLAISDLLFVNYLDADCSVCIQDLKLWDEYLKNEEKNALFIIAGSEKIKVDYMINNVLHYKYPVFYDEYDSFVQINDLSEYKAFHSFQLKNKKVLKVGSPILLKKFNDATIEN